MPLALREKLSGRRWLAGIGIIIAVVLLVIVALMWWWTEEPSGLQPAAAIAAHVQHPRTPPRTGVATTATVIETVDRLLGKRGGYLSNDKLPPGAWLDNIPNWEFGVVTATRDVVRVLRNDFSRSQAQSVEDPDLAEADPLFQSPNDRWLLPSTESQYAKGRAHLQAYLDRLTDANPDNAHFYARADNLADYLQLASSRLGSLSQRLSASVGQLRLDEEPVAARSAAAADDGTATRAEVVKTPWTQLDDTFYEARGYTWALLMQLRAIKQDFAPVLRNKRATVSLDHVIRELTEAQHPLGSPVILNGSPFGLFANHSLVMANYVARANAAILDLRTLLQRG